MPVWAITARRFSVVKTGKAAVLDKPNGTFTVQEYQVPDPKPGTFILKTELAGVCATDAHMYHGGLGGTAYPIILGHEICGIIDKLGEGVTEDTRGLPVKEGDRVIVIPGVGCGTCYFCAIAKTPTVCSNIKAYGFMPDDQPNILSGGYSQYIYVQYPNTAFLKTSLPANIAVLTEPVTISIHGLNRSRPKVGTVAVVQGTGAIGFGAIYFLKRAGAYKVIAIGGPAERLELAKEFGADVVIDIEQVKDPAERIRMVKEETIAKRGADIVFEAAGFPSAIPEGLQMMRTSGDFVELGMFTDRGPVTINPHTEMMLKNANIYSCWGGEPEFFVQGLPFLEKRDAPWEKLVNPILPLSRAKDAIDAILNKGWKLEGQKTIFKSALDPWMG
jgi:L-iditol 2-dehydrogenase